MEFSEDVTLKHECVVEDKPVKWAVLVTFHCGHCNTVLSDSFSVCGEAPRLDSIICMKVTADVIVTDTQQIGHRGDLDCCIYSHLKCGSCSSTVGKVIHAAPVTLSVLRPFFLLSKEKVSCYVLNTSQMVKASTLSFDQTPFRDNINQIRQTIEETLALALDVNIKIVERNVFQKQKSQRSRRTLA